VKKVKKVKNILELSQNVKKVHAILNSIVDFADFSRKSDGGMLLALARIPQVFGAQVLCR